MSSIRCDVLPLMEGRMKMVCMVRVNKIWIQFRRPAIMVRWCSVQQFRHESNVGYSQTKRFNAGKPFLVGKCWDLKLRFSYICHIQRNTEYLSSQLVKCLVQIEHSAALPNVGCPSLGHRCHPAACFLCGRLRRSRLSTSWRQALTNKAAHLLTRPNCCKV